MSFLGLLTIVFIVLKLVGVITWSWWLVFAPVIAAWVIFLSLLLLAGWAHSR